MAIASFANSDAAAKSAEAKWTARTITDATYRFSVAYFVRHCEVAVYRDGSGIEITAMEDMSGTEYLIQRVTIRKIGDNSPLKTEQYSLHEHHVTIWRGDESSTIAEDVFYEQYRTMAQSLPDHVKRLFFGNYGIR